MHVQYWEWLKLIIDSKSFVLNHVLHPPWHGRHKTLTHIGWNWQPSPPALLPKFLLVLAVLGLVSVMVEDLPKVFNWVKVRTLCWPFKSLELLLRKPLLGSLGGMFRVIILLKYGMRVSKQVVHTRNHAVLKDAKILSVLHLAVDLVDTADSLWWHAPRYHYVSATMLHSSFRTAWIQPLSRLSANILKAIRSFHVKLWLVCPQYCLPLLLCPVFLCALANWSLFFLLRSLIKGFFTAILPCSPACCSLRCMVLFDKDTPVSEDVSFCKSVAVLNRLDNDQIFNRWSYRASLFRGRPLRDFTCTDPRSRKFWVIFLTARADTPNTDAISLEEEPSLLIATIASRLPTEISAPLPIVAKTWATWASIVLQWHIHLRNWASYENFESCLTRRLGQMFMPRYGVQCRRYWDAAGPKLRKMRSRW